MIALRYAAIWAIFSYHFGTINADGCHSKGKSECLVTTDPDDPKDYACCSGSCENDDCWIYTKSIFKECYDEKYTKKCEMVNCCFTPGDNDCKDATLCSRKSKAYCEKAADHSVCMGHGDIPRWKCCKKNDCGKCSGLKVLDPEECKNSKYPGGTACRFARCCHGQDCQTCLYELWTFKECCKNDWHVCPNPASGYRRLQDDITDLSTTFATGKMCGEPHIMRWGQQWFDYQGECDLVLVDAPDFHDGLGLTIHVRTTIRYDYSYISSAAVKIGNDILQVNSWGEYSLNGVHSAAMPNTLGSFDVNLVQENEKRTSFQIDLGDMEEGLEISTFKDIVAVEIDNANQVDFNRSAGLMGQYGTGLMLGRDGATVIKDPNMFGQEWQVRSDEPVLFETIRGPQCPEGCILPSPEASKERRRQLGEKLITRAEAEEVCSHVEETPEDMARCIFDVVASNDLEMAELF